MKSHTCDFHGKDLLSLIGLPLVPVIIFAVVMRLGASFHLLPHPRPTLDIERTIILHQAEASRSPHEASVLLLGDSSCLIDVSARQLSERLKTSALNLGTLRYLDLNAHVRMLREYSAANPGRLRTVVLLMHPEALRGLPADPYYVDLLQKFYAGMDHCSGTNTSGRIRCLLGLDIFKGRLLSRLLPVPLPGAFGRRYGFTSDLEGFMTRQNGSVVEPDAKAFEGDADYRLARSIEEASRALKTALPPGVKLAVGITPAPEGFVQPTYEERRAQMLAEWSRWVEADAMLHQLPATLPDKFFANKTHLNERGVKAYTEILARALEPYVH